MISLIRGHGSKCNCIVCLAPSESCSDLSQYFPLRTAEQSQAVVEEARSLRGDAAEALLKSYGLRNVDVSFEITLSFNPN